ncbi:MAG: hypothetical protein V4581_03905 [Bacteroidota bacterium]
MIQKLSFILIFSFFFYSCQKREETRALNFSIAAPENWIKIESESEIYKSLYKENGKAKLEESRKINKNFRILNFFLKYENSKHIGPNPTIQVQVLDNGDKNFNDFYATTLNKIAWFEENLEGFELTMKPNKVKIYGVDAVSFSIIHLQLIDNVKIKVKSIVYMIPDKHTLIQITFNDFENDNCSKEFKKAIKSIRL